ncbi:MAG: MBL fold metallo-hydrolase [Firmicutes bacterium]|nr:MBL fold metallo-hydrolase [Bacillota bacterium]
MVVDPLPDLSIYLDTLNQFGLKLRYVIDTHIHADHLSGAAALAEATGAALVMHELSPLQIPFTKVRDQERLELGNVLVEIWHTPGHTPEHISLVIADRRRGPEPWCVLTGHTLMIGDAGRPDLLPEDGSDSLYRSLFDRLATLPDYVEIYPGAYAGST